MLKLKRRIGTGLVFTHGNASLHLIFQSLTVAGATFSRPDGSEQIFLPLREWATLQIGEASAYVCLHAAYAGVAVLAVQASAVRVLRDELLTRPPGAPSSRTGP